MKRSKTPIITSKRVQNYLKLQNSTREQPVESQCNNMIYLDKNENPYNPSLGKFCLSDFQNLIAKYPDPMYREFLSQVSEEIGYPTSYIIAGAGSDELLDLIFRTYLDYNDIVLSINPTFSMYKKYAEINGATYMSYPLELKLDKTKGIASYIINETRFLEYAKFSKILVLARPNNPDGSVISKDFIVELLKLKMLTVIDEAYIEFSEVSSLLELVGKYDNLIIIRTLSKSHALAGMRLGYAIANPLIIEILKKVKSPYNVTTFGAQLGISMMRSEEILENIQKIKNTREVIFQKLLFLRNKTTKFYIHMSQGNFILIRFLNPRITNSVYQYLLNSRIKVRIFEDQLPNCIRVSIGTNDQMDALLKELETFFEVK